MAQCVYIIFDILLTLTHEDATNGANFVLFVLCHYDCHSALNAYLWQVFQCLFDHSTDRCIEALCHFFMQCLAQVHWVLLLSYRYPRHRLILFPGRFVVDFYPFPTEYLATLSVQLLSQTNSCTSYDHPRLTPECQGIRAFCSPGDSAEAWGQAVIAS